MDRCDTSGFVSGGGDAYRVEAPVNLRSLRSSSGRTSFQLLRTCYMQLMKDPQHVAGDQGFASPALQASSSKETSSFLAHAPKKIIIPAAHVLDLSSSTAITTPISSGTCTSGLSQQLKPQHNSSSNSKLCQVEGCQKGARGASGRCISHGGGRRC